MAKLLLCFAGLPGVGKSTISRTVMKKIGAKIVDIDDFKRTCVDPTLVTSQIDPPELRWVYYRKALEHTFGLFDGDTSIIILDEVFHIKALRSQLQDLCAEHGVEVVWVEVRCSYEVVERRLRSQEREGHILSTDEALRMNLLFEEIFEAFSPDQKHVVVNNGSSPDVDRLVEEILRSR